MVGRVGDGGGARVDAAGRHDDVPPLRQNQRGGASAITAATGGVRAARAAAVGERGAAATCGLSEEEAEDAVAGAEVEAGAVEGEGARRHARAQRWGEGGGGEMTAQLTQRLGRKRASADGEGAGGVHSSRPNLGAQGGGGRGVRRGRRPCPPALGEFLS